MTKIMISATPTPAAIRKGFTFGCAMKISPMVIQKMMIAVLKLSVNAYEQSLQINSIDKYREEIFRVYKECVNDKGYEISAE